MSITVIYPAKLNCINLTKKSFTRRALLLFNGDNEIRKFFVYKLCLDIFFFFFFTFKHDLKCLSLGLPFMELLLSLTRLHELNFIYAFNFQKF